MITGELKSQIDQIWNIFYNGGISNTITIIEQLTFLIFIKDLDETETKNEHMHKSGVDVRFIFGKDEQQFRWKNLRKMDVSASHQIFSNTENGIFPFLRNLGEENSMFSQHLRGAAFGINNAQVLDQVIEKLECIDMNQQDLKGDVYEYFLSKLEGGGTSGQFRTPRHIIKLMVELMKPKTDDIICDPSIGTAGFLVAAKEYIDRHYSITEREKHSEHITKTMFNGTEFDATMLRIASMNLYLHGVKEPNIRDVDAVSKDHTVADAYTLVLANPPFKGTIDKDNVSVGLKDLTNTSKTELLFLALILRELKLGGRAAVIVPDGVLYGSSNAHKSMRKEIVENQKLEAVISLPSGVFKPYARVSTAILIFTKSNAGGTEYVWFYDMKADGRSLDDKRSLLINKDLFEKFSNSEGVEELTEKQKEELHDSFNLPDILARYPKRNAGERKRKRTEQSFTVPFQEIKANAWDLSINRYKENICEKVDYDDPRMILERIVDLDMDRNELMNELSKLI